MKTLIENGIAFYPPTWQVKPINLLFNNDIIEEVSEKPIDKSTDTVVYNVRGKLVVPGFVDGHTHLAQSFGRGIYDNQHLTQWLNSLSYFYDLTPEEAYVASLIGCIEALKTGTTTVAEMTVLGEQGEMTLRAIQDSGLRAVVSTAFGDYQEGENPPPKMNADQGLLAIRDMFNRWQGKGEGRITMRVSPVGLPACTEELMRGSRALANELGVGIHTHCCEGETETANSYERFGVSEVEVLARCGVLGPDTQLVHCIWLNEKDKKLIAESGSHVITCPSTNTKVTDGMPPMPDLYRLGVNIGIGCDGEASSGSYDMLQEARLVSLLGKVSTKDAAMFPAEETYAMMTANGSRAIGLGDQVGALEVGRKADITVIDYPRVHLIDEKRLLSNLIYSATGGDVDSVFVGGKPLIWHREMIHLDEEAITAHALELMKKATHLLPHTRKRKKQEAY
jgi:5-methylthioadenosine/S-adenosylhomocysteine deaminase